MTDITIYWDLDLVLADTTAGIRAMGFNPKPEFNVPSNELAPDLKAEKRAMFDAVKGNRFYETLPIMEGAVEMYIEGLQYDSEPHFLTAAPLFDSTDDTYLTDPHWLGAAYRKRHWVENKFLSEVQWQMRDDDDKESLLLGHDFLFPVFVPDDRFICTTSTRKQLFIHRRKTKHQVLIDDRSDNIARWNEAGGFGVLHTHPEKTLEILRKKFG